MAKAKAYPFREDRVIRSADASLKLAKLEDQALDAVALPMRDFTDEADRKAMARRLLRAAAMNASNEFGPDGAAAILDSLAGQVRRETLARAA